LSVDYEHLAACASLPSSSLLKERGDLHLRPVKRLAPLSGRPGLYRCPASRSISFLLPNPSASPLQRPVRFSAERGFYSRYRSVSTAFFRLVSEAHRLLFSPPHPTSRPSAERGFYRSQRTVSTTFFSLIPTAYTAFLKPIHLPAERGFYRTQSPASTTFFSSISTA